MIDKKKLEKKRQEYCNIEIKNENHLDRLLEETNIEKYINYKISYQELEERFPFFKSFRLFPNDKYHMFSYSSNKINNYFRKTVITKYSCQSSYTFNYLIHLYHQNYYWN